MGLVYSPVIFNSGSGGGGSSSNSFTTIQTPLGTSPVATSPTDTLSFTNSDTYINLTGNSATDTVTIDLANYSTSSNPLYLVLRGSNNEFESGAITITGVADVVQSTIKGVLGQTKNLHVFTNSASTVLGGVGFSGKLFFGVPAPLSGTSHLLTNLATTDKLLLLKSIASNTADILEIQNSSATRLYYITSTGIHYGVDGLVSSPTYSFISSSSTGMFSSSPNVIDFCNNSNRTLKIGSLGELTCYGISANGATGGETEPSLGDREFAATVTAITNCTMAGFNKFLWSRVGNTIHCALSFNFDYVGGGMFYFETDLPVPSAFIDIYDVIGVANGFDGHNYSQAASIYASVGTGTAVIEGQAYGANYTMQCIFHYKVRD